MSKINTDNMTPPTIVVGAKEDAKPLRWVASATAKVAPQDSRQALSCLYVNGAVTVAMDAFRLHVIPTPPMLSEYDDQMVHSDWPTAGKQATVAQVQVLDGTYPAYMSVVKSALAKPAAAKCYVSGKYLADFCAGLGDTDMVEITIPQRPEYSPLVSNPPITLATVQNPELRTETPQRWALIMPMHFDPAKSNAVVYSPFVQDGDK